MIIADLKETCPVCKGSGQQAAVNDAGLPLIKIDGRCQRCAGRGFLLTELGQDVLKTLRPFIADLIDERLRLRPESSPGAR